MKYALLFETDFDYCRQGKEAVVFEFEHKYYDLFDRMVTSFVNKVAKKKQYCTYGEFYTHLSKYFVNDDGDELPFTSEVIYDVFDMVDPCCPATCEDLRTKLENSKQVLIDEYIGRISNLKNEIHRLRDGKKTVEAEEVKEETKD